MRNSTKKKIAPIAVAAVAVMLLAGVLLWMVLPLLRLTWGASEVTAFLAVYAVIVLTVMGGIIAALCQRLREIKGGEEEDARKY